MVKNMVKKGQENHTKDLNDQSPARVGRATNAAAANVADWHGELKGH